MPILRGSVSERQTRPSKILPQAQKREKRLEERNAEYQCLLLIVGRRKEIGFYAALADLCLEPQNPFDHEAKRKPRGSVTLFGGLFLMLLIVFLVSSLNAT